MKKKYPKYNFSEDLIVNKYLSILNFNKKGTYNFKNDAAYIQLHKTKKLVVTSDSISENIDFFKGDDPKSIANKITTVNISDLSAMGANPYCYALNIFIPKYIDNEWVNMFTHELFKIEKKYNFYLIGGDLSKSNNLAISSTFFGFNSSNIIVKQNYLNLNDDIWITGNLGDSYIGLQILQNKITINDDKLKNYFLKKYYYPKPCLIGPKIANILIQ